MTKERRAGAPLPTVHDPYAHAHSAEIERAVLSVVLDGRNGDAWGKVREQGAMVDSFWTRNHRLIALVIDRLWSDGQPVDALSVATAASRIRYAAAIEQLQGTPKGKSARVALDEGLTFEDSVLAGVGGHNAIGELAAAHGPATGLERNAQLLAEAHAHRRVIGLFIELGQRAQAVGAVAETGKIIDEAIDRLSSAVGRGKAAQTLADAAVQVLADHDQAQETGIGRVCGSWGLDALDQRMPLKAGRMITVAGDPGGGKTSLTLTAILATARKLGRGSVAMIPLEQDARELVSVLVAREIGSTKDALERGWLTAEQRLAADHMHAELAALDVYVRDGSGSSTIRDITGWVLQRQRRSGGALHLVVLDHIGLVDQTKPGDSEYVTVSAASKAMKHLTRRGLCVLNVAQLNREGRKAARDRNGEVVAKPEPRPEDLRGSGSLEQDSDGLLFLWCRSDPKAPTRDVDLLCLKNRDGGGFQLAAQFHAADGQRFALRQSPVHAERVDVRALAAERVAKTAAEPSDTEDLFT
ncbi:MAG TPA: DnaB-like helicase C-terminal domain-containing protein [Terriglobales bacterium]|nr:DnaB-like helicase C-terminal domain-containing protein [Terriglobales bacterium]